MDAAKAGKHVLCEKPIAQTVADGEAMVQAMDAAGRLLAINLELLHSDSQPEMKRLLDSDIIGSLKAEPSGTDLVAAGSAL